LTQNNTTVVPHRPSFSLFPPLKIELKSRHFDTVEVDGADTQAVLNGLAERDFQDAFKKMAESLMHRRGLLAGRWWPVGAVSF
jgi:hypothetical protein